MPCDERDAVQHNVTFSFVFLVFEWCEEERRLICRYLPALYRLGVILLQQPTDGRYDAEANFCELQALQPLYEEIPLLAEERYEALRGGACVELRGVLPRGGYASVDERDGDRRLGSLREADIDLVEDRVELVNLASHHDLQR